MFAIKSIKSFKRISSFIISSHGISTKVNYNQKVSMILLNPRNFRRVEENEKEIVPHVEEEKKFEENIIEIENNLFDNQRFDETNHKVDKILKQFKKNNQYEERQHSEKFVNKKKKNVQMRNMQLSELEIETIRDTGRIREKVNSPEIYDEHTKLSYIKLHKNDPQSNIWMLLVTSRKQRDLKQKLVMEGKRLIMDATTAGLKMDALLFDTLDHLTGMKSCVTKNTKLIKVQPYILKEWSDLVTSPGIIGIFDKPERMHFLVNKNKTQELPVTVICDNIREPNNLGSIIRSCAAVSVSNIILLKGCTHPWEPKCLRGGTGAHFRVKIDGPLNLEEAMDILPSDSTFYVADNNLQNIDDFFINDNYDRVNYRDSNHKVVVIGGETHGISKEVKMFIDNFAIQNQHDKSNFYIHLPLENGIESLNTASALTVILYEIKKQLNK